jgi:hypothetical protein
LRFVSGDAFGAATTNASRAIVAVVKSPGTGIARNATSSWPACSCDSNRFVCSSRRISSSRGNLDRTAGRSAGSQ